MRGSAVWARWRAARPALWIGLAGLIAPVLLDTPDSLATPAWRMAGVAFCMAVWWIGEALPLAGTALLPLVAYPLLGIESTARTAPAYANPLIFLFFGGFCVAIAMERWQLHRRIALQLLRRMGTSVPRLLLGFSLGVAFLSMWVSNTATTLMMLPVAMAVVRGLAEKACVDDPRCDATAIDVLGPVFLLTIAYSASAGGIATLVGTPPNIVLAGALAKTEGARAIGFAQWMGLGLPLSLGLLVAVLLVVPRLGGAVPLSRVRIEGGATDLIDDELARLGPLTRGEAVTLGVFVATAILWLTRTPIRWGAVQWPGWAAWLPDATHAHDATVAVGAALLLLLLRVRDATGEVVAVLDWRSVADRTPWGVLLLFGGGFALAQGIAATGLTDAIARSLGGLEGAPTGIVVFLVSLATTFLTEVTSNTATSTVLMPVLAAAAQGLALAPALLMIPAALSASCAFMLPVATPPNAIVFGSGWVTMSRMVRVGLALNLIGAAWITLLTLLLVRRMV